MALRAGVGWSDNQLARRCCSLRKRQLRLKAGTMAASTVLWCLLLFVCQIFADRCAELVTATWSVFSYTSLAWYTVYKRPNSSVLWLTAV